MKIKLKSIQFLWSESNWINTKRPFDNFAFANSHLSWARLDAPEGGAYDKTDFVLTFEDGNTYTGRYDLAKDDFTLLQDHVKRFCEHYGKTNPEYAEFLNKYEL